MKKMISLLLIITVFLSLCACGNDSSGTGGVSEISGGSISDSDLVDEWFEVKTAKRLVLKSNGDIESYKNVNLMSGNWALKDNNVEMNSMDYGGSYEVIADNGGISLANDTYTFMKWTDLPKIKMGLGEKGESGGISLTVNNLEFLDALPSEIINSSSYSGWGNADENVLGDGMVYAKISIDVCNLSKSEIELGNYYNSFDTFLDYANGFRFATYGENACYYVSGEQIAIVYNVNASVNPDIPIAPLETKSFDIYIECPEKISSDNDSPLFIGFIAVFEGEPGFFEVDVRS